MEFLRFGSTIPGTYWGCCAVCIIQNFKTDPDQKTSIQLVGGDGGNPVMLDGGREIAFAGPTYRDVFHQRIRFGTFDKRDMPNHGFLAILTQDQISGGVGLKWLKILREAGFEFIRTVSNSVYQGQGLAKPKGKGASLNHIFGLFRNIGNGAPVDPFTPPVAWSNMDKVAPEINDFLCDKEKKSFGADQYKSQHSIWEKIGPAKLLTEAEVIAAGAPVILAGLRSEFPQQPKETREQLRAQKTGVKVVNPDPFGKTEPVVPVAKSLQGPIAGCNCAACLQDAAKKTKYEAAKAKPLQA